MKLIVSESHGQSAKLAAGQIEQCIQNKKDALLGLATGETPVPVYEQLVLAHKQGRVDFSRVRVTNLDEYQGLEQDDPCSYYHFMRGNFLDAADIPDGRFTIPKGNAEPAAELRRLNAFAAANVTDLQLLGVGVNGHVGFNEPADVFQDGYHIVELTGETKQSNACYFPGREIPGKAFTMGVGNIMRAREVVLIAFGEKKTSALRHVLEQGPVTPRVPVSILKFHPNCTIYVDKALMRGITPGPGIEVL